MKAIMVMFDSLNRRFLPPYGSAWVHAPNFTRLAERGVTFDDCYGGSMPCMPARREMHTGRYNFLHRGWGPLEPFDDSVPEILKEHGVHTHLATDHQHYWEDGGATYHPRFSTFEFFRGQEGDEWKGHVVDPGGPETVPSATNPALRRQDRVNRLYMREEGDHPQTLTFDAGLGFVRTNHAADGWFCQIETFDPHEPFFSYDDYTKLYPDDYGGPEFDWPDYKQVTETPEQVAHARNRYAALLSMCDRSLGRVLDVMDELGLWEDTLLIVCTDHGFLLGEHDWWGKNAPPFYDETIHLPLFVWDPRSRAGGRRASLVQTIDLGPTLLEFFGIDRPADMHGVPLRATIACDTPVREAGLFGIFGGHVNVTDGRHVYMRACAEPGNRPLAEYTLMPTHMRGRFPVETLRAATVAEPFSFTKGVAPLRAPGHAYTDPYAFGTLLYDLAEDPDQREPLVDDALESRMARLMVELMRACDAPPEQYARLGLPETGPVTEDHLLVRAQWERVEASRAAPMRRGDFPDGRLTVDTPVGELLDDPAAAAVLRRHLGALVDGPIPAEALPMSLLEVANLAYGLIAADTLRAVADELARL